MSARRVVAVADVRVALDSARDARAAADAGADGVGLLGLESAVLGMGIHPARLLERRGPHIYAELLSAELVPVCQAFAGRPVWVRTLDFAGGRLAELNGANEAPEANPLLGWHGIRRDLDWPEHHAAQWMAVRLAFQAGCDNAGVLLSFVHDVEQLRAAQWMRDGAGLGADCGLGILVETPAAALCLETFIDAGVDFVSFHTDRLAACTLGVDPTNPRVGVLSTANHPAVLRLVAGAAAVCAQAGVETSVCGRAASDPELARRFLEYGIDSVTCAPEALPAVREAVAGARGGAPGH